MATNVPAEGIQAYMDDQARQLTPSNASWKIKQWFTAGSGVWLIMAAIVIALLGPMAGSGVRSLIDMTIKVGIVPLFVVIIVLAVTARPPGIWRRYPLHCLHSRYPHMREVVRAVRHLDPDAEFEVAVLEWRGSAYGMVLFQVFGQRVGSDQTELVVQVYSPDSVPVEFGGAYAVPAT